MCLVRDLLEGDLDGTSSGLKRRLRVVTQPQEGASNIPFGPFVVLCGVISNLMIALESIDERKSAYRA